MLGDEIAHRAGFQHAPLTDDHQIVGGERHLAHQVRAEQHGATLAGVIAAQFAHPFDALGVEAVDWLVQHEVLRVAQQRARNRQALAHAERELAGLAALHRAQAGHVDHFIDAAFGDVIGVRERAQVVVGGAGLVRRLGVEHRADGLHRRAQRDVSLAVDERLAGVGVDEAQRGAHRGGFARAVGAQEPGDFAVLSHK